MSATLMFVSARYRLTSLSLSIHSLMPLPPVHSASSWLCRLPFVVSHIACALCVEVFDTYTYSDVGFDGDACPPCIVMQPPVATLQTWMDAQDRTNPVWEEQVLPPPLTPYPRPLP